MIEPGLISGVTLFSGLDESRLARIAAVSELVNLAEGELLTQEGAEANSFYILLDGIVSISKKLRLPSMGELEGEDRILTTVSGSDLPALGETALLGGTQRAASMRCNTRCSVVKLNSEQLRKLMDSDHTIARAIYGNLCTMLYQRLESANNDVVKLSAALVFALEA